MEPTEAPKTYPGHYGRELEGERDSRKRELEETQKKAEALEAELKVWEAGPAPEVLAAREELATLERKLAAAALKDKVLDEAERQGIRDGEAVYKLLDLSKLEGDNPNVKRAVAQLVATSPFLTQPEPPPPPTPGVAGVRRPMSRKLTPNEQLAALMRAGVKGGRGYR